MQQAWASLLGDSWPETVAADAGRVLSAPAAAPLSGYAVLAAAGADAAEFLHNQFSHDIKGLAAGESRLAAYCNPKGRMLALVRLWRHDEGFCLLAPRETLVAVLPRLKMFVLRSKVALSLRDDLLVAGLAGDAALDAVGSMPLSANAVAVEATGETLIRLPGPLPRGLLLAPAARMSTLWPALTAVAAPVAAADWELLDVRAGLPEIYPATQEAFVPQMANLDLVDGISFNKGCYPGQEIVARMHYLGKLKRRMFRFALDGGAPPAGGEVRDGAGALVGQIVRAAPAPEAGAEALAVVQIERAAADLQCQGQQLRRLELPYPVEG